MHCTTVLRYLKVSVLTRHPEVTAFFRLDDHLKRLYYSAAIYRIPIRYSFEELREACFEAVRSTGLESAYIRPLVARGNCGLGVIPKNIDTVDVSIMVDSWGAYLGEEGLRNGIRACITSWQRLAPNTIPTGAKAGGNYLSSQLIGFEAKDRGFDEGIALGHDGLLSEGAGENLFLVKNGRISHPANFGLYSWRHYPRLRVLTGSRSRLEGG